MTLAHVKNFYLESNLMAVSPSSHLDPLYADLQMHALSASDGLAKVFEALGFGSLTIVMGRFGIDLTFVPANITLVVQYHLRPRHL